MAKVKNDYFKMIEDQVGKCAEASRLLEAILCNYDYKNITSQKQAMHTIEHEGDTMYRDILGKLYTEFITPIDQEDILRLVQLIDDIADALDEVIMECYMFYVTDLPKYVPEFATIVNRCVGHLHDAAREFKGFKKPDKIKEHLDKVNATESEADKLYEKAMRSLFSRKPEYPADVLLVSKTLYDSLEHCCDLCEVASDVIEQIIIKNT